MSEEKVHPVPAELAASAHINAAKYEEMYRRSVDDPDGFWADAAEEFISWSKKWDKVSEWDFKTADIKWYLGGKLNVSYNCLDRHLATRGDQTAIIW
ncbi:MAG: acetyl-coenzyme A synthetase, partial [Gammaproteobacteria bacterium]|nr:acetyl-coenzyme A synthetase [Gammaproteobacteria bacterium]